MKLSAILDPIDPSFMADTTTEAGGIRISNSAIAILLFLFAQTLAGVWWASAMNEKMGTVVQNNTAQSIRYDKEQEQIRHVEDSVRELQDNRVKTLELELEQIKKQLNGGKK